MFCIQHFAALVSILLFKQKINIIKLFETFGLLSYCTFVRIAMLSVRNESYIKFSLYACMLIKQLNQRQT